MRCPVCQNPTEATVPECPICGLRLKKLDAKFGTVPRDMRYLTDQIDLFSKREEARLDRAIRLFERKFTKCFFSIITTSLKPGTNPREYLFWLFNRGRFGPLGAILERNFSLVLLIDVTTRSSTLTTGYGLENILPEPIMEDLLACALPYFEKNQFLKGCLVLLSNLEKRLIQHFAGIPRPAPERPLVSLQEEAHAPLLD